VDEHVVLRVTSSFRETDYSLHHSIHWVVPLPDEIKREANVWIISPPIKWLQLVIHLWLQRKWGPPKGAPPY